MLRHQSETAWDANGRKATAILVDGVTKIYSNGTRALNGVSFEVAAGETFGILGANGAGKTTLIRIVTTLMRPTTGQISIFGQPADGNTVTARRRMGIVSQDCTLDHHLTVIRNLSFHGRFHALPKRILKNRIEDALSWLGLEHCANTAIHTLSGGTRRKVMLARALLTEPELLILDEPTTGLDPETRAAVWAKLRTCNAIGTTILLSSHHRDETETLCHRVGIIIDGRIRCDGPNMVASWFERTAHV